MNKPKQRNKPQTTIRVLLTLLMLPLVYMSFCSSLDHEGSAKLKINDLPDNQRHFLEYARYLINKSEKKKFLSIVGDNAREQFIQDFWKKRDPSPETDENEFKEQYYQRIEEANRMFGNNGWRSDRGKVLVLLGPPETKHIYPTGIRVNDYPSEIWLYGYFPIIFVDRTRSGNYELTNVSAWHLAEMNKASQQLIPQVGFTPNPFGFKLKLFKDKKAGNHQLQVLMPYRNIVFEESEEGFSAHLKLHFQITEKTKKETQTMDKEHTISVTAEQLDKLDKQYVISVPLNLAKGYYEISLIIENKADKVKTRDKIEVKL